MLGHKLVQILGRDADVWGTLHGEFDAFGELGILDAERCITHVDASDEVSIRRALTSCRPDVVVNAVGVVKQLPSSKDVITTLTVNSIFPHRLAQLAAEFGFRLITISTDCVFDGEKGSYTEDDRPNAADVYGKSKELGEVLEGNCLTIRTSIIGRELKTSHSLVEWFLSNEGRSVNGFTKAIYSGFPTIVLAGIIRDLIFDWPRLSGLFHVSSEAIDKFSLLELIKKHYGANIAVEPSDRLRIDRSLDSSRFREITGFVPEDWETMIGRMASDPTPYNKWK